MSVASASKLLWTLLAGFLLLLPGTTPEGTITEFIKHVNAQDYKQAAKLVQGGKPAANYTTIVNLTRSLKINLGEMNTSITGNRAVVTVSSTLKDGSRPTTTISEKVNLVKVNGEWLIVAPAGIDQGNGVVSSIASMTTNPSEVFVNAKKAAQRTTCISNLKQLAVGMIMLSTDYNEVFKVNPSKLKDALRPYTKNDELWYCPTGPKGVPAYSFNSKLVGKSSVDIQNPANTVMMYEGSKGKLDFRHNGYAAVAFADGHVKSYNAEQAAKLNWNP